MNRATDTALRMQQAIEIAVAAWEGAIAERRLNHMVLNDTGGKIALATLAAAIFCHVPRSKK